jgi:hypothetical protein
VAQGGAEASLVIDCLLHLWRDALYIAAPFFVGRGGFVSGVLGGQSDGSGA